LQLLSAKESDSARLKTFFERMILPGTIDLSIRRQGSFFDHYRLFSDNFKTLMLVDDEDNIQGVASLLFREGYVRGEKQTWGYATDLRIAPTRKAIAQWAQRFLPVLESACEERNCKYVFSSVQLGDNQAYNALIRPTSHTRRRLPRYHLMSRFRVTALHGRYPFAQRSLDSIRVKMLQAEDLEKLCVYLREHAHRRPLATEHTPESLLKEIQRWPGLAITDFRVAVDGKGRILGCAALWDGRNTQALVPQAYHGIANTVEQSLRLAGHFRLARPFARVGKPLATRSLIGLCCDSAEIFHRLADEAFARLKPDEVLTYLHFRGDWRTLPPRGYIATSLPYGFFLILPPNAEAPTWEAPGVGALKQLPPDFELAWL
jgi:hypothetical protein